MSSKIKENSFDAAPGGIAGSINMQPSLGTQNSSFQDPSKFYSSNYNKYYNKDVTGQPDTAIEDNSGSFNNDVEKIFKKKNKPTIDDVLCGIQYELQNMIKKDKRVAKEIVINNIKKHGPKYYTKLHMLNIDDKNMDINPIMKERINVLNKMVQEKIARKEQFKINDEIQSILKEKMDQKTCKTNLLIKVSKNI